MQLKLKSPDVISYLFRAILKFLLKGVLKLDDGFRKSFTIQVVVESEGELPCARLHRIWELIFVSVLGQS